jgi:DNA invertase Pin-like site-specific DNA recombinase
VSIPDCVRASHLSRLAVVYVRQSSQQQTINHQESLKLQYNLVERARACGWASERIRVIDADLGLSGRNADNRPGFQEMVSLVNLEQVGVLFAYDVTRLARNCTDWYQLLDLCGYRSCLVADQDGVYDPSLPNGRLILGLKGLMAELELHTIRRRMMDGLQQKARRGELAQRLPVGLERDALGQVVKTPDQEIQTRLALVFERFLQLRTMSQVVRSFNGQRLEVPRRDRFGDVVWRPATTTAVYAILSNPAYAGAFVRGRRRQTIRSGKRSAQRLPQSEWPICVRDKYPAYIDWKTFEAIQTMLRDNHADYQEKLSRGTPRAGRALLSGLLYCGECGHKLRVHYHSGVYYSCDFLRTKYGQGPQCQRVAAAPIDRHVAEAFVQALAPAELEVLARAQSLAQQEGQQQGQARQQQIERLRYQAQLAERQFNRADPDNRLVAAELERRWEAALWTLKEAEEAWQRDEAGLSGSEPLDPETARAFAEGASRVGDWWQQQLLTASQQKALLRCLVEKVVVRREGGDAAQVRIVWRGGATSTSVVPLPAQSWENLSCTAQVEEAVGRLAGEGKSDQEIAEQLTRQGLRSPRTSGVSVHVVRRVRDRKGLTRPRQQGQPKSVSGYLTVTQLAQRLGVNPNQIYERIYSGRIEVERNPEWKMYLFPDKGRTLTLIRKVLEGKTQTARFKGGHQDG